MVINLIVGVYVPIIRIPIKRWDGHPQYKEFRHIWVHLRTGFEGFEGFYINRANSLWTTQHIEAAQLPRGDTGVLNQWNSKTSTDVRLNVWLKTILIFVDFWPAWFFVGFDSFYMDDFFQWPSLAGHCYPGYILSTASPEIWAKIPCCLGDEWLKIHKNTKTSILGFVFFGDYFTDSTMDKSPWKTHHLGGICFFSLFPSTEH